MGTHGMGQMNENWERFPDLCSLNHLVIGGIIFPHKRIYKATWRSRTISPRTRKTISASAGILDDLCRMLTDYRWQIIPIISTSNTLFLRFTSDESESRQGFQFSYTSSTAGQCWDPGVPTNGDRDNNSNFTSGQTVRYTCMDGYQLWGTANITCQPSGTWSGATPTCGVHAVTLSNLSPEFLARVTTLLLWGEQTVVVEGKASAPVRVASGVPEGTV
ncbi:hypothetical protein Bbelb_070270 [Branchiostoma belcheri]|nr:hypothetical protein Bbelb_070270 [Branchiostoma belcheri]